MPEATILIIFATAFIVGLSGALMPGPLLTITISETARRGFWVGPSLVLGHGIAEFILVVALSLGLAQFLHNGAVTSTIGLVGGAFLLWMAYGIIRGALQKGALLGAKSDSNRSHLHPYLTGILASVLNPTWPVWWATIGSAYILWSLQLGIAGLLGFFAGHILSDLSWYTLVSFLVATGRKIVTDTIFRSVLFICGLFLIVLSGLFIFNGIQFWINGG